ncbi:MAG: hypothetical protein ACE5R6_17540 [Candidatus Heimdallarchaeota archaeon]
MKSVSLMLSAVIRSLPGKGLAWIAYPLQWDIRSVLMPGALGLMNGGDVGAMACTSMA